MTLYIDCLIFEYNKAPGYQEYLFSLLDYFSLHRDEFKYDDIVLIIRKSQESHFLRYRDVFSIVTFEINGILSQISIQSIMEILLRVEATDVILFTYNYSSLIKRCKHILVVHDLQYLHFPRNFSFFRRMQRKIMVPRSVHLADRIIAISECTRNDIVDSYGAENDKVVIIYNYCDFKKFEEKQSENSSISAIVPDSGVPYFLCVSSLAPHKNIKRLLKAFSSFLQTNSGYYLIIVSSRLGLGDEELDIISNSPCPGNFIFTGYIGAPLLAELYRKCIAFILPTLFEGFGIPIVEAEHFGARLLLSDIMICHEIAGENAEYFDPKNIDDIKRCLCLVTSSENQMGKMSYNLEKFSSENTSLKYIKLLNSI